MLIVQVDGSSLGNPGPSGAGVVLLCNEKIIHSFGIYLGTCTNNIAEYWAMLHGMKEATRVKEKEVLFQTDSMLVMKQLKGEFKTNDFKFCEFQQKILLLAQRLKKWEIQWFPRERNQLANDLAQQAARSRRDIS